MYCCIRYANFQSISSCNIFKFLKYNNPPSFSKHTINVENSLAKLSRFSRFSRVPWKFSCEYKHLSLITLNNEHFWPTQHKSISVKTLMGLKPWMFSPANLSMSTVYTKINRPWVPKFILELSHLIRVS